MKILKNKGIDIEKGIRYCADSEKLYRDILLTAWEESEGTKTRIRQYGIAGRKKEYYHEVHTLKNVAGTIGADGLAEMAREHCEAIKKNEVMPSPEQVTALLSLYEDILEAIADCLR